MKSLLISVMVLAFWAPGMAQELDRNRSVVFLGLTFIDTSTEGAFDGLRADQTARLELVENAISARFMEEGFVLLGLGPIADELDNTVNPANCYGCELRMARKLGASYVVVGVVQKVSNLIISMNLVMRDVETGVVIHARAVDVRSNTDKSWLRGMNYILKHTFFKM
ncbi:MAG: DUF3280 domain-containing protein [Hyphomicrobiales bacterium]|nr:DUF3280 domain-containing protein [Hyphomicrobiales bacterium]